jgi:hypothetical protein
VAEVNFPSWQVIPLEIRRACRPEILSFFHASGNAGSNSMLFTCDYISISLMAAVMPKLSSICIGGRHLTNWDKHRHLWHIAFPAMSRDSRQISAHSTTRWPPNKNFAGLGHIKVWCNLDFADDANKYEWKHFLRGSIGSQRQTEIAPGACSALTVCNLCFLCD